MSQSDDRADRFDKVKDYLESLTKWAPLDRDDTTVVVDVGDLELKFRNYRANLDELLSIAPVPENRDRISTAVAKVWATAGDIKMVCDDLERPLNRLVDVL